MRHTSDAGRVEVPSRPMRQLPMPIIETMPVVVPAAGTLRYCADQDACPPYPDFLVRIRSIGTPAASVPR